MGRKFKKCVSLILAALIMILTVNILPEKANAATSGQAIVDYAKKFLGYKYVYGAEGPNTFDCSGFTKYVYKNVAGIDIGRTTYDQIKSGRAVSRAELQLGDLVLTSAGHVGIYVGDGKMIHAPQTGDVVKISDIWSFYAGRRILENVTSIEDVIFDHKFYSDKYSDLKGALGEDKGALLSHFKKSGMLEGRCTSLIFDLGYYLKHNQDLANAFGSTNYSAAYNHFINSGYKEERDLSPIFNMEYYKKNNPDIVKAFGNDHEGIINHFLTSGIKEGRQGSENFNVDIYKENYEDLRNLFGNDNKAYYRHYMIDGIVEGRIGNKRIEKTISSDLVFDYKFYSDKYSDLKAILGYDKDALVNHFNTSGMLEGRCTSLIFDLGYYLKHNQDLANAFGSTNYSAAYKHFTTLGYKEQRDLSPIFNLEYYIKNNPDVAQVYGNDYEGIMNHFLTDGMVEGRQGSENFNVDIYKENYEDLRSVFGNDNKAYYRHYMIDGIVEGRIAK